MATKGAGGNGDSPTEVLRRRYVMPLAFYKLKDIVINTTQRPTFFDTVIITLAFVASLFAVPFYPWLIAPIIVVAVFLAALYHPFLGLIITIAATLPALFYQAPAVAPVVALAITFCLVFGYKYYRTIVFAFMAVAVAFSQLGLLFIVPVVVVSSLVLGRKREMLMLALFVAGVVALSGLTSVQNSAYLIYVPPLNQTALKSVGVAQYLTPGKPYPSVTGFPGAVSGMVANATSLGMIASSVATIGYAIAAFTSPQFVYVVEFAVLAFMAIAIDEYVVSSRDRYRGVEAGFFGAAYPLAYLALTGGAALTLDAYLVMVISVLIGPFIVYFLQIYDIDVVKALDVRKEDTRMKFGEAFEDLQFGTSLERFKDIGNYESTKKELKDAVLDPLEARSIARAYNITPAKGLLFFGPPGTGKTMMMRALANEIHASFFYVKASDLLSAFAGESERKISNIFAIAKKHTPCVLFFDEIDSIGASREKTSDEARSKALSQLLIELDGFQKIERVIFVGATNVPDMLDPALMRAGRVDKVIYMPLPSAKARRLIFQMYLKRYPLDDKIDISVLVAKTERYSGADIKMICNTVAQTVAQDATEEHKVLRITQRNILDTVAAVKPSTSLAQLDMYEKFRIKFERSVHGEASERLADSVDLSNVVGLDNVKKALVEAIQIPLLHPDLVERYKVRSIRGILMFGPPGNGKTMLMKAAMNDESMRGVKMLTVSGSELAEEGIDKANAAIKETFNLARENEPALIFIDEIDGIAPARGTQSWITSEITTELLKQMDGLEKSYKIIVVAATNRPEVLDTAILRPGRFDKIVFVRPPNAQQRAELFKLYLSGAPAREVDFDALGRASEGYTGADIADICREIKTAALEKFVSTGAESGISTDDVMTIIKNTKPSAPASEMNGYSEFAAKYGRRGG